MAGSAVVLARKTAGPNPLSRRYTRTVELAQLRQSVPFGSGRDRSCACVRRTSADGTDCAYGLGGGGGRVRLVDAHQLLLSDRSDRRSAGDLADLGHALRYISAAGVVFLFSAQRSGPGRCGFIGRQQLRYRLNIGVATASLIVCLHAADVRWHVTIRPYYDNVNF